MICVDNLDTGSLTNLEHIRDENFVFVNHDLTEPLFLDKDVDFVYHLASPASPIDYMRLPLHTLKVGALGTLHALGLAKSKRAGLMLASTSEVYGDPKVHPAARELLGQRQPHRSPRCVTTRPSGTRRRSRWRTTARHGVDDAHRADLQHVRPADAPATTAGSFPRFIGQALAGRAA